VRCRGSSTRAVVEGGVELSRPVTSSYDVQNAEESEGEQTWEVGI
jgi:hypothetical protein